MYLERYDMYPERDDIEAKAKLKQSLFMMMTIP